MRRIGDPVTRRVILRGAAIGVPGLLLGSCRSKETKQVPEYTDSDFCKEVMAVISKRYPDKTNLLQSLVIERSADGRDLRVVYKVTGNPWTSLANIRSNKLTDSEVRILSNKIAAEIDAELTLQEEANVVYQNLEDFTNELKIQISLLNPNDSSITQIAQSITIRKVDETGQTYCIDFTDKDGLDRTTFINVKDSLKREDLRQAKWSIIRYLPPQ